MDKDKLINWSLAFTLTAVATFAAVVSYSHIYDLGIRHMYHGNIAFLLPLSVDGLIVYSSLVLLYAARNKLEVPNLARLTLWLGILATVLANVAYGLPGGPIGAIVSAWPAVAFICVVETGMQIAKAKRIRARRETKTTPVNPSVAFIKHEREKMEAMREAIAPTTTIGPKATEPKSPRPKATYHHVEGEPRIKDIRSEFGCGQAVAYDIRNIMREHTVDMHKAKLIRDERKNQS